MTAGKVQPSVQAQIDAAKREVSGQSSVQRDDFTKLLQVKKDEAQQTNKTDTGKKAEPEKAEETKTEDKTSENVSEDSKTEEMPADDAEEEVSVAQETLQQAVLQQAAVQMLIQPDAAAEQVPDAAPAVAVESSTAASGTETVSQTVPETAIQAEAAVQVQPEEAENVKTAEPKAGQKAAESSAEKPVQEAEPQKVTRTQERSDSGMQTDTGPKSKPEVQTAVSDDRKVRQDSGEKVRQDSDSRYGSQDTVYSTEVRASGQVQETSPMDQRTEQIPLKTTPEQLPQDLGKMLAAKNLDTGRTLTVELEPANLGKLTIKLVYEGDRASLSIMASNPRTLEMLNQRASEIAAILEEKTGQETIIYTQPAQQGNEQYDEEQNQNRSSEHEEQKERQQNHGEDTRQVESFAQQLRLGLV